MILELPWKKISRIGHLSRVFTKKHLHLLPNIIIIILTVYFLGHAINIVWDNDLLHSLWGNPITNRKLNVGAYFQSHEDPFFANVVFYFETEETFCAYNPIHVRAVLFGNKLSKTATQE